MTHNQLKKEVLEMIIDELGLEDINVEEVNYDAPLFMSIDENEEGLGLDSVDALEIVVGIKKKYKLKITDEDKNVLKSISTIAEYVHSHMIKEE
ncbi:phosphopantetheine-binding protein [Hathewaya histolytica]|uniref:phosphopantetheine-binding protein n=1 Tax=Hathewaya histolytica TaxID=1498 RepID=UPI003B67192E